MKVGTLCHSLSYPTCAIVIMTKENKDTDLGGSNPYGAFVLQGSENHAKETEAALLLSRLSEPLR